MQCEGDAQEPAIEAGGHRNGARSAGCQVRDGGARVAVRRGPRGGHGGDVRDVFAAFLRGGVQAGEAFFHTTLDGKYKDRLNVNMKNKTGHSVDDHS